MAQTRRLARRWVQQAHLKAGALHRQLGIPAGETIPVATLRKAAHAPGKLGKRARLALTMRSWRHNPVGHDYSPYADYPGAAWYVRRPEGGRTPHPDADPEIKWGYLHPDLVAGEIPFGYRAPRIDEPGRYRHLIYTPPRYTPMEAEDEERFQNRNPAPPLLALLFAGLLAWGLSQRHHIA